MEQYLEILGQYQPLNNQQALESFLSLQDRTFPETPQYTANRWNKRADFWEMERKLQRKDDGRVTSAVEFLTERGILTPQCQVADIGCGPGRFAAAFAQRADRVVGFDISEKMVAHGNAYLQSLGISNAQLMCQDFAGLDLEKEGYRHSFDLVFSSITPAIHNINGLLKSMEMSRAWCLNISHICRRNELRQQILREVFHKPAPNRGEGRAFYSLFNILFLMGYHPETSFFTRRKENRVRPDREYVEFVMEHALPPEEHTAENAEKIHVWLNAHTESDGYLTEISEAVYGRILWDVRSRIQRPEYR